MIKIILSFVLLCLAGCSSYQTVDIKTGTGNAPYVHPVLKEGDRLQYVLKNGIKGELVFSSESGGVLTGRDAEHIALRDIASLERKSVSAGKTAAATGAGIGIATVVIVALTAAGLATALIAAGG